VVAYSKLPRNKLALSWQNSFYYYVTEKIVSPANPRIKELVKLRESPRKRRERGAFVVEGLDDLHTLTKSGKQVEEIFYCEELIPTTYSTELLGEWEKGGMKVQSVAEDAFRKASYRKSSDGILAVVRKWSLDIKDHQGLNPELVVVLDEVEKPGNLGAIFRTAEALGVDAILLSEACVDFFNPNVVRSSRGLMGQVPVFGGTKEEVFDWLRDSQLTIFGTSSKKDDSIYEVNFDRGSAFVLGSEKEGLGSFWESRISKWCTIPMLGKASSLNLNACLACLLSEYNRARQRG
jgi:TrmH family RNA methyltransferase|tara:strand:- start:3719 stop:4594 length:876 start_codon:yes stop_codon:yes gene_type:complete